MKRFVFAGLPLAVLSFAVLIAPRLGAQDQALPKPAKAHEWLKQLVGEWVVESEASMGPGTDPIKVKGTEKCRMLGDFWLIADGTAEAPGMSMKSVFTLGYNGDKKKYVGTWIDSMTDHLWTYEGTLDDAGNVLTMNTEGPDMMNPGKTAKFREVITIKGPDEKAFSSSMLGADGKWLTFVKSTYKRKK